MLYVLSGVAIGVVVIALVLGLLYSIDWQALSGPIVALVLMLGFLYWTTTLLPGPVKKLGKAAGRQAVKAFGKKKHE